MRYNPFEVVDTFEQELCRYTGAKYAVATTSCTMALLLSLCWWREFKLAKDGWWEPYVDLPKHTYVGVAMSALHAGFDVYLRDIKWSGAYKIHPTRIVDSARRFHSGMYRAGQMQCVSFHWSKILSIGQGGAILLDDPEANAYLRSLRYDGRTSDGGFSGEIGYHAYMMPRDAAEGLTRLYWLPDDNADLPNSDYPDLSKHPLFA